MKLVIKHIGSFMLAAAVLSTVTLFVRQRQWHIPANAGGSVDIEMDAGRIHHARRINLVAALSQQLIQHPEANRFRIVSRWGDCGISGRHAVVYDRNTHIFMSWAEAKNDRRGFGGALYRSNYAGLQEKAIHKIAQVDMKTWIPMSRKQPGFDFLQKYGCTKINSM